MTEALVSVSGLTHLFSPGRGIEDVTFAVEAGEVVGYLGPNGAGKTITLEHLMGRLRPQRGTGRIAGMDAFVHAAQVHRQAGYLSAEVRLFAHLTGRAHLELAARVRGLTPLGPYARRLADRFEADLDTPFGRLSRGRRQVVGLIVAFAHDPAVMLLDEPSTGLDPVMEDRFVDWIVEERGRGKAILMSSHRLDEVERTADLVCLVRGGRVVHASSLDALRAARRRRYRLDFAAPEAAAAFAARLAGMAGIETARRGASVTVEVKGDLAAVARAAGEQPLLSWKDLTHDLEDALRRLTGSPGEPMAPNGGVL